jgi:hypothetical protein
MNMLHTAEIDMANSVKPRDIDVFLSYAAWAIFSNIWTRHALWCLFIADWNKIEEYRQN